MPVLALTRKASGFQSGVVNVETLVKVVRDSDYGCLSLNEIPISTSPSLGEESHKALSHGHDIALAFMSSQQL